MIYQTIKGEKVPTFGLGTWLLNAQECVDGVAHALEIGYRHIDTAQGYDNEAEVGAGLKRANVPRDDIFLVTKLKPSNFHRDAALRTTDESLRKLGTDYVDLLLLHWPNPSVPLEETMMALNEIKEQGKARHVGVSNFPPSMVNEAQRYGTVFSNQVEYHPYLTQDKLHDQAKGDDYMLTAYSPIARGKVFGDDTLKEIGAKYDKNEVQVTLRWLVQQDNVAAIPKAASAEHREANAAVAEFELTDDEMTRVHALNRDERLIDPADGPDWER